MDYKKLDLDKLGFKSIKNIYRNLGDSTTLERTPFETLAKEKKLSAFKHEGFWHPMDTLRDKKHLGKLWTSNKAPWKIWE